MSHLQAVTYHTVTAISSKQWIELECANNAYFSPKFLKAFEVSNPNINFKYIVVNQNSSAIALAIIQTIELSVDVILKNIKLANWLKKLAHSLFCNNSMKIMTNGNIFLSGEHGLYIKEEASKIKTLGTIAEAINNIAKHTKSLHAIVLKDFLKHSLKLTTHFENYGFTEMHVEPNLILELDTNWKTFDDYKKDLKSKYRVKVNKADSSSNSLTARLFTEEDFATYKEELQKLYENTIANANFNAQVLNLDTYIHLREIYHDDFIVKAYFLENKLVGFLSALANNNHLDAHFIGLNYNLNREHAIYPRILNDYVRIGLEKQVSHINFGRTASEIKTTIGAIPVDLTCYIKHKRPFMNRIIKFIIKRVKLKEFKQHHAFKTKKEATKAS
ncbi:hypothetical protein [Pontimicrobium aquaticum]|uniref:Acetyltransferase (GNAT) domain-containing protein n=1 Tax=Pontimicrobium aquaticum TaxID=2565367 RepID=A0A4U0F5M0_9FLAO|nr:hypothetical protein [Pontimicrobium aquaticum]TJY38142.1 hypothetical protein E5167_02490 [Pontimicrobium aquaticum]